MNDKVLCRLIGKLCELSKKIGFSEPIIKSNRYSSKIYIENDEHALELEVDWMENDLYMYVVYLKDRQLPDDDVIYSYPDGQWCRKFLEEIYEAKPPKCKDKKKRYSSEFFYERFEFYKKLIENNLTVLTDFYHSISKAH